MLAIFYSTSLGSFEKVIIWGHKLHSHTHSYVHKGFYDAFKYLGYPTYWFDQKDDVSLFDFSNALFLTEGQIDQTIPLKKDSIYVTLNCNSEKHKELKQICLQVYTDSILSLPDITKVEPFIYFDLADKTLFMPWATNLLPFQIEAIQQDLPNIKKRKAAHWVGTIGEGLFGNRTELDLFDGKIVYNPDPYQLFYDAQKRLETITLEEIHELMNLVKTKHTYLNRIQTLCDFLKLLYPETQVHQLDPYKKLLEWGTYEGQDWSSLPILPKSRYDTFRFAFEHLKATEGKVIVELGTSRSFCHGGLVGCNSDDPIHWSPKEPKNWDWGAGFFTRMAALALADVFPLIYTVDISRAHIERCKIMTKDFSHLICYQINDSVDFLREYPISQGIDLLYLDTGDITPIEPSALLQLEEAKIIVERDLISEKGFILIDDVKNRTPRKFGDLSDLGKSKYSLPFLLSHGFEIVMNEYQVILRKCH
ncbi:MAG: hypothetical protein KGJ02_07685 [Verrucomicrobiota bacterium]|nr:hypothetical protein [Verrucomicrobiota bacterium]